MSNQSQDIHAPIRLRAAGSFKLALSAQEVAEVLGVSRAHVWRLHSSGRIPKPVRLGRAVRWNRKTLEDWLEAGGPSRDQWESSYPGKK